MIAPSASIQHGFVPKARPRLAISGDGALAAVHETERVSIIELPSCMPIAEIGIDPEAVASDVAWVGSPARLLVLSRFAAHSTVHLLDPNGPSGPRSLAELRLEAAMRLVASVGAHALAVGANGAAILTASDSHVTPYQFPARSLPVAGGAVADRFVVALAGSIEEWDPNTRMPTRKLKLARPTTITAIGGTERALWMTTQADPTRVDVLALVNRGQPKTHQLPEPIAHAIGHPRGDVVGCIGADTGKLYMIDLDGRAAQRTIAVAGLDRVEAAAIVPGRTLAVLAAQMQRPLALAALDREPVRDGAPADDEVDVSSEVEPAELIVPVEDEADEDDMAGEPVPTAIADTRPSLFRGPTAAPAAGGSAKSRAAVPTPIGPSLSERFSTWRERMRNAQPRSHEPASLAWIDPRPSWRDDVTTWARAVAAGSIDRGAPTSPMIDEIVARFEISPQLAAAITLLYGSHLAGEPGATPIDIARVVGRRWDEALGRGVLAERGIAVYRDSRIRLAVAVQRALDELPVQRGTMVGNPGQLALLGPCVVVAATGEDGPLGPIAERCLPAVGGAILAGHPTADPRELFVEARAYGAAPMLRVHSGTLDRIPVGEPAILVVADAAAADLLDIPRLQ